MAKQAKAQAEDMRSDQDLSALERHGAALKLLSERLDNTVGRVEAIVVRACGPLEQISEPPTSKRATNEPQGTIPLLSKLVSELDARVNKVNNMLDKLEVII